MAPAHDPTCPGEVLVENFLNPAGISTRRLAQTIAVPIQQIDEIVRGERAITADTAIRLSRALGTSDRFWLNLQNRYDLDVAFITNRETLDQIQALLSA